MFENHYETNDIAMKMETKKKRSDKLLDPKSSVVIKFDKPCVNSTKPVDPFPFRRKTALNSEEYASRRKQRKYSILYISRRNIPQRSDLIENLADCRDSDGKTISTLLL